MKALYIKDHSLRHHYYQNELIYFYYKFFFKFVNHYIKFKCKKLINLKQNKNKCKFIIKIGKYRSRINSRCLLTNRSKAVFRKFHLSRIMFRNLALRGILVGVKKSSF